MLQINVGGTFTDGKITDLCILGSTFHDKNDNHLQKLVGATAVVDPLDLLLIDGN